MKLSEKWIRENREWLCAQRLPFFIVEGEDVHVRSRWFFTRGAVLPGSTRGRGHRARKYLTARGWRALGDFLAQLDDRVYLRGKDRDMIRTFPVVWRFRDRPPVEAFGQPVYANTITKLVRVPEGTPPPSGPGWQQVGYTEGQEEAFYEWSPPLMWTAPKDTPLPSMEGWVPMGWDLDDLPGSDINPQED